ncbi:hypothetical protein EMG21_30160 [Klebsiella pneumoniae]|nr:hypothetical protein EMG21_30160 [Klebsiella pneumoniae]
MAGSPANASVWAYADVLIGPLDAEIPVDGEPFGADWDYVGLLNGDDGFSETQDMDSTDHFAWGGILVATTRSNYKLTRTFTAFEDNETVFDLAYPGHDVAFSGDGTYGGDVHVPDLQHRFKIAFVTRSGQGADAQVKRVISKNYAQVEERGDATESETEISSRQFTVAIYPTEIDEATGKATLFSVYKGPELGS